METIGFIGLGNMGGPMAANLVKAGHHVRGFDLAPALLEAAARGGVEPAASVGEAAWGVDAVITMLPDGHYVIEVYRVCLTQARAGTLFIDCSTIDVASAREVARHGRGRRHAHRSTRRSRAVSAAPRRARSPSWSAAPMAPSPRRGRSWSRWAEDRALRPGAATARRPRSATT